MPLRRQKFTKPLLKYLEINNNKVKSGMVLGFTWSNNGVGVKNNRKKIDREIGAYMYKNGYEEIDMCEYDYGEGGCMNVMFIRKL